MVAACADSDDQGSEPASESASESSPSGPIRFPQEADFDAPDLAGTSSKGLLLGWYEPPDSNTSSNVETTFPGEGEFATYTLIDKSGQTVTWDGEPDVAAETARLTEAGLLVTGTSTGGSSLGGGDQVMAILDPETGEAVWEQPFGQGTSLPAECSLEGASTELVLADCGSDAVFLDAATGEQQFTKKLPYESFGISGRAIALDPPIVDYWTTLDEAAEVAKQHVDVLDPKTGEVVSTTKGVSWPTSGVQSPGHSLYMVNERSYFPTSEGIIVEGRRGLKKESPDTISALDPKGNALWSVESDGELLAANSSHVLVAVESTESLVLLDTASGEVSETIEAPTGSKLAEVKAAEFVGSDVVALDLEHQVAMVPVEQLGDLPASPSPS